MIIARGLLLGSLSERIDKLKKAKATRILDQLLVNQKLNAPYIDDPNDFEYMDFITVYYNIGSMKNLRWCNTVNEALEVIEALPNMAVIALDISDEFKE